jgi:hypothetical protein
MVMSIQDFFEKVLIPAVETWSPEQKSELRQAWRDQLAERVKENDKRFLRSAGIDPDGD